MAQQPPPEPNDLPLHIRYPHYHKNVEKINSIGVYKVLELWDVRSHAVGHAIKKLLCAGGRGSKGIETDLKEAIASIKRELQLIEEREGPVR